VTEVRPVVGVGAVLLDRGRVLLIRRGKPPLLGQWSLPGGTLEPGETLRQALVRELREETALDAEVVAQLEAFERIERARGRLVYHYVIVDFLCRRRSGRARAGSDARAVAWARPRELARFGLQPKALELIRKGLRLSALSGRRGTTTAPASRRALRSRASRRRRGPRRSS
jgi:mutator protein MutT